jgi:hypothetical protein
MTSKYKYTKQDRERDEQISRESERRTWPTEGEISKIEYFACKREQQQPQHQQQQLADRNPVQQLAALEEAHLMALQHAAREQAELEALLQDDSDYKDDNFNNATIKEATIDGDDCKDDNSDDEYFDDDDPFVQQINNQLSKSALQAVTTVKEETIHENDVWDFQKKEPLLGPRFETSSIQFEEYFTTRRFDMNPNDTVCEFWYCPIRNQTHKSFSCTCGVYHEDCKPDSWNLDTRSCSQCQKMMFQVSLECQKKAAQSQYRSIIDRKVLNIACDVPRNADTESWLIEIRSVIKCRRRLPGEHFLPLVKDTMNRVARDPDSFLPCYWLRIHALIDESLIIEPAVDTSFDGFVNKMIVPDDKAKVLPENRTSSLMALYQAYYRFNEGKNCPSLSRDCATKSLKKAILSDTRMKGKEHSKDSSPSITYIWNGNHIEKSDPKNETNVRGFKNIRLSEYGLSLLNSLLKDNQIFFVKDFLNCLIPDQEAGNRPENRSLSLYSFFQMESSKRGFKPEVKSQPNFTSALKKAMKEDIRFAKVTPSASHNPHKTAYKWSDETKQIALEDESPKLRGFNGLRIKNIIKS